MGENVQLSGFHSDNLLVVYSKVGSLPGSLSCASWQHLFPDRAKASIFCPKKSKIITLCCYKSTLM